MQGLHANFVECESFLESNPSDILAICEVSLVVPVFNPNHTGFFLTLNNLGGLKGLLPYILNQLSPDYENLHGCGTT